MCLPWLSVIIPVYNESAGIITTLSSVDRFMEKQGKPYEIIIVDDGSTDGTYPLIQQLQQKYPHLYLIKNQTNEGKGAAVRKGMLTARGRWHLFCDADLSTPLEEVDKLLPLMEQGYTIVIGSRSLPGSKLLRRQPWWRELPGRLFRFLVRITVLPDIMDSQCGFKLFSQEASRAIFRRQFITGFAFDVEILYIARKLGLPVAETQISWTASPSSSVKLIRDGIRMLVDLGRIKASYFSRTATMERPTGKLAEVINRLSRLKIE